MRTVILVLWKVFVFGFALILPGAFVLAFIILARRVITHRHRRVSSLQP